MNKKIDWKAILPGKFPKKNQWVIVMLVGILLILIAMPTASKRKAANTQTAAASNAQNENYENKVEQRLAKVLKKVDGVGEVKVMVTLEASSEKVVEKDVERTNRSDQSKQSDKENPQDETTSDTSVRESTVYSENGSSGQEPYVSKELSPTVEGVLVIADGGDNPVVVQNITEAIQALFGVESHKIKVMKRNQEN